jgi:hypothetical protein
MITGAIDVTIGGKVYMQRYIQLRRLDDSVRSHAPLDINGG